MLPGHDTATTGRVETRHRSDRAGDICRGPFAICVAFDHHEAVVRRGGRGPRPFDRWCVRYHRAGPADMANAADPTFFEPRGPSEARQGLEKGSPIPDTRTRRPQLWTLTMTELERLRTVAARFNGAVCILVGLAVNRWTVGFFAPDGRISSLSQNLVILAFQAVVVGIGIWFVWKKPVSSPSVALVIGATIGALIAADIVAVATGVLTSREFVERHRVFYGFFRPDAVFGHTLVPNLTGYRLTWLDDSLSIAYDTDALGFRNPGRDYDASRLWFLGDSFTFGDWVEREDAFYGLLETTLGEPTISLGVSAYGVTQYALLAERYRPKHPSTVVGVCIFANDLMAQPSVEALRNEYAVKGWDGYESLPFKERLFSFRLIQELAIVVRRMLGEPPTSSRRSAEADNGIRLFEFRGASPAYMRDSLFVDTEAQLERLIDAIRASGAMPIIFLFPSKESTYQADYVRLFGSEYLQVEDEGFRRICDLAAAREIGCVDLTTRFRRRGAQEILYFTVDPHWNERGHALAAFEMADSLSDMLARETPAEP